MPFSFYLFDPNISVRPLSNHHEVYQNDHILQGILHRYHFVYFQSGLLTGDNEMII